ncbi:lysophospholipase [Pseudobutyrivibrio sp. 49]|uniref:alpha/beta fold hydrolase n=1 Tax=unclassified Pseudobutyrivibrio TaxID=2638619 RepID=UPI00088DFAE4|nr:MULTISPECIES: alpha/beta fold hydrolase [unclassified Pseudobutyrivibrio]SDI53710.1 lysophospholipase [Pseudobutyrivibrio sp. 49]SFN92462.1 lysophospholipase [Pseudobutyrivibrio sp. UC1225]
MNFKDIFIEDKDFANAMQDTILPFMNGKLQDGYFVNTDGLNLHYQMMINPAEKASIVISHGYCEFATKFTETIYYFYKMGYSVFIVEHRGHGFSDRQVEGFSKVYVDRFENYVKDFNQFIEKIVIPESKTKHLYLFAHSMGGGIGAMYLEKYPKVFEKAVLTSPMIRLVTHNINSFVAAIVCILSYLPMFSKRYLPKHHDYDHTFKYPHCSAMSKARYTYQYNEREREPHYRTNGATFAWIREALNVSKKILKNAHLIEIPVILMQASKDTLVMSDAQEHFCQKAKNCKLIRFEGSKHEIFNATDEIIQDYYSKIFEYYEN